jgi:hypothetical protein
MYDAVDPTPVQINKPSRFGVDEITQFVSAAGAGAEAGPHHVQS